jgi:hypothetical protein
MKIKKIIKINLEKKIPVYCLSVQDHEVVIKCEKKSYRIGQCNFSLEFGSSAFSFAKSSLQSEWGLMDCEKYIEKNNLYKKRENLLNLLYGKNNQGEDELDQEELEKKNQIFNSIDNKEEFSMYWACACDIRKKHFELYSGLKIWIDKTIEEAKQKGYVKSIFGAFRRLPRLLCCDGKDNRQSHIKNLCNISLNTGVQNFEIAVITLSMIELNNWIKENNIKAGIYGMVHDSCKLYIHTDYEKACKEKIFEIFQQDRPEFKGVPIRIEGK